MKTGNNIRRGVLLSFLLGLVASLYVYLGVYFSLGEVVNLVAIPWLLLTGAYREIGRTHRVTIALFGVWLLGVLVSDWYRESSYDAVLRGVGQVVMFFGGYMTYLGLLQKRLFCVDWYMLGFCLSKAVNIIGMRPGNIDARTADDFEYASWKLVYGNVCDCAAFVIAAMMFGRRPKLASCIVIGIGLVNIAMGARSMGGIEVIAAVSALVLRYGSRVRNGVLQLTHGQRIMYAALFLAIGTGTDRGYFAAAKAGYLGVDAQAKAMAESAGRYGAISSSRVQLLGGCLAIVDSPIIGYGSWALDHGGYGRYAADLVGIEWRGETRNALGLSRMPSHSYLIEFWVEHGLLGGVFWLWIGYHIVRLVLTVGRAALADVGFGTLLLFTLGWNYLFSPLGDRLLIAAWLVYLLASALERRQLLGVGHAIAGAGYRRQAGSER